MNPSNLPLLIVGGGIGGLAAALAAARAGQTVRLFERSPEFSEVGAGIQIGPNVVRVLQHWGLERPLRDVAAFPERIQARSAVNGDVLGTLPLGQRCIDKYGAPYATIHRADMHRLLRYAVEQQPGVDIGLNQWLERYVTDSSASHLRLIMVNGKEAEGHALIGADGLWSRVRQLMLGEAQPRFSGHLAYRALIDQGKLPQAMRTRQVTAWLGPRLHVVQYPVRRGEWMNIVAIIHGEPPPQLDSWDHNANTTDLELAFSNTCTELQNLIAAVPEARLNPVPWRLWALCDRPPVAGAHEMAKANVALLGDAAHPMRPYLAQGAGMAIEDAAGLERVLAQPGAASMSERLAAYAAARWQRCARVQARSIRNGSIYHASGLMRVGRDSTLKLLGEHVMDLPWLYRYGQQAQQKAGP